MQGLKLISAALCAALLLSGCMDLESRRMRIEQGTDVFTGGASRFERMKAIADKGDPTAQFKVAEGYYLGAFYGQSVEKNLEMAKRYYIMAVNNPHDSRWQKQGFRELARERLDEITKEPRSANQQSLTQQRNSAEWQESLTKILNAGIKPHKELQAERSAKLMKQIGTQICRGSEERSNLKVGFVEGFSGQKIKIRLLKGNRMINDSPENWYVCE